MATSRKAKGACGCYDKVDAALREDGLRLPLDLCIDTATGKMGASKRMRIVVERDRKGRKLPMLIATYCPTCGAKYPAGA